MEVRVLFGTPDFAGWVRNVLPDLKSTRKLDITPLDQFDDLMISYCLGEELLIDAQFHALRPIAKGVWELKTPDLRIFGWFPCKDHFIAVAGHFADGVKKKRLYGAYVDQVVAFRDGLDLDPPKFLPGDDHNVVVSNCSFP